MTELDLPVGFEVLRVPKELQDKSFLNSTSVPLTRHLDDTHHDVIVQFGRFPHRNAALGRSSTPDEQAWLDAGGGF